MSSLTRYHEKTFEDLREHLFNQFQDPPFEEDTGISSSELEAEVRQFIRENPGMPKVQQKAHAYRIVVTRGRICVDPLDWFADKLDHGGILRKLSGGWLDEAVNGPIKSQADELARAYRIGLLKGPKGGLDLGHIAPGWDNLLAKGLAGLLDEAAAAEEELTDSGELTGAQADFFAALRLVYGATIELSNRFADLCVRMADEAPEYRGRLTAIAEMCRQVPARPPRSFHEALQCTWLMHELIEMEGEFVRSMGQFDRSLFPFYRSDVDSGVLDPDHAKELIKFYWMKWYSRTRGERNGKNFVFGGQYPDGTRVTNELTYVALDAYEELNTPDPKLSVRFTEDEGQELYERVADLVRKGHNSFVLLNDPVAVEALRRMGKTDEDSRYYLPIGCYEPAVEGREAACTMNVTVNLAKILELTLHGGRDPLSGEEIGNVEERQFETFGDVLEAYLARMKTTVTSAAGCIAAAEGQWPEINPSPLLAGTFPDCVSRGRDIGQGGPRYNSVGFVGAGLANAADSLMALKKSVFDEKLFSFEEVVGALHADFVGHEEMRRHLVEAVPKWGNDNPEVDGIAKKIADEYCETVHSLRNRRGGRCQAALFTLDYAWRGGKLTGALPDGRRAGESLAPGTGATYGRDGKGVTALLNSVLNLEARNLPNGSVLDVTLHPSAVSGESGLAALTSLIRTFFLGGGYALQFNVYDVATLRDAQRHPERFSTLQVRLTGWSVYFTSLTEFEQEQFIQRISHSA